MREAIIRLEARLADLRALDVSTITKGKDPAVRAVETKIMSGLSQIYGADTYEFERLSSAGKLDRTFYSIYSKTGPGEIRQGVEDGRQDAIAVLSAEVASLQEALEHSRSSDTPTRGEDPKSAVPASNDVFIIHGRDDKAKVEVARLVERAGLKAIILHEQANSGRTIIEKFEGHGGAVGFAIAVMTPDDVGGLPDKELYPRARQNVIGEMFWFAGRLGRDRVCALKKGDLEMPSDFAGVGYTDMDDRGAWKAELLRELAAAGYTVDWGKALA
jgi:predicted nucleotide-binding protein